MIKRRVHTYVVLLLKSLPARVSGFFLWSWIYGWGHPRWGGIYLAARVWYHSLVPVTPPTPPGGRRGPRPSCHRLRSNTLTDREWYSLEETFPGGVEPFQDLAEEFFEEQQNSEPDMEDLYLEGELLWSTRPNRHVGDELHRAERDIFVRVYGGPRVRRGRGYARPNDDPVELWTPRVNPQQARRGLSRLVNPGDGPTVGEELNDLEDEFDSGFDHWSNFLGEWYFFRSSPTRMTQTFTWPETFYHYLLFEHRRVWGGDPLGRPGKWSQTARGSTRWLHKRFTRDWDRNKGGFYEWYLKSVNHPGWWGPAKISPWKKINPDRTRWALPRTRSRRFKTLANSDPGWGVWSKWGKPLGGRFPNYSMDPEDDEYFPNDTFNATGFARWRRVRQAWTRRFPGGVITRWMYPKFHLFGTESSRSLANTPWLWRWVPEAPQLAKRGRPGRPHRRGYLPWVAPRWGPAVGVRTELPDTGGSVLAGVFAAATGVVLSVWALLATANFLGMYSNGFVSSDPTGYLEGYRLNWLWQGGIYKWNRLTTSGIATEDFFRRVSLQPDPDWAYNRTLPPRERWTTRVWGFGVTRRNESDFFWSNIYPVGEHWWDHPGLDQTILVQNFIDRALIPISDSASFLAPRKDWVVQFIMGWNSFDKANWVERRSYFPYQDIYIPAWAHADGVIGDEWVVFQSFVLMKDTGFEPETVRRMIDHRYNMPVKLLREGWGILYRNTMDWTGWWRFAAESSAQIDSLHRNLFLNPEWIPPGRGDPWRTAYLDGWEDLTGWQLTPNRQGVRRWRRILHSLDGKIELDLRAPTRNPGFTLLGVATLWEPHLNQKVLAEWSAWGGYDARPPVEEVWTSFFGELLGLTQRVWTEIVLPVWGYVGRIFWVVTGVLLGTGYYRWWGVPVRAVSVHPVTRATPGATSAGAPHRGGILPNGKDAHRRDVRSHRHRREKFRERHRIRPDSSWRWIPHDHWREFRVGFSRRAPLTGRRRARPERSDRWYPRLVGSNPGSQPTHRGGGLSAGLIRSPRWRWNPTGNPTVAGSTLQVLTTPAGGVGWLARPRETPEGEPRPEDFETPYPGLIHRRTRLPDYKFLTWDCTRPLYHRPRRPRGLRHRQPRAVLAGSSAAGLLPDGPTPVIWRAPPGWLARAYQRWWHLQRYRNTLAGITPIPSRGAPVVGVPLPEYPPGVLLAEDTPEEETYSEEYYFEDYSLDYEGHQGDEEEGDLSFDGGYADLPVRYHGGVTPPRVVWSPTDTLTGWPRRGSLPGGWYQASHPGGITEWGPLGVDHPTSGDPLWGGYEVPRYYRRLTRNPAEWDRGGRGGRIRVKRRKSRRRWGIPLWSPAEHLHDELGLTGWTTPGDLDDADGSPFGLGTPRGGGYHPRGLNFRPRGWSPRVWSPAGGLNGWHHLLGEPLGFIGVDSERVLLEGITTEYTDGYEIDRLEEELGLFFDREDEDYLGEGAPYEDLDYEVPRTRPRDYPPWIVEIALAGVSPGETSPEGMFERLSDSEMSLADDQVDEPTYAGRSRLQGWYRRYKRHRRGKPLRVPKKKMKAKLPGPMWAFPAEADPEGPREYINETAWDEGLSDPLYRRLTDGVAGVAHVDLDEDEGLDNGFPSGDLRVWALTEVYFGDYPVGSRIDS